MTSHIYRHRRHCRDILNLLRRLSARDSIRNLAILEALRILQNWRLNRREEEAWIRRVWKARERGGLRPRLTCSSKPVRRCGLLDESGGSIRQQGSQAPRSPLRCRKGSVPRKYLE